MTFRLRKPISPVTVAKVLDEIRWAILWLIVPSVLLQLKKARTFFLFVLLVFLGFVVPGTVIKTVPVLASTAAQIASFVLRFGFAYCLMITCCVGFARLTSAGKLLASHPKTADLP